MILDTSPKKLINDFLEKQANLDTLRFITCEASTMERAHLSAGCFLRLAVYWTINSIHLRLIPKHGTQGKEIDFALL